MKRTRRPRNRDNHLYRRRLFLEQLEDRRMLAGVTVITHGWQPAGLSEIFGNNAPEWTLEMANYVLERAGGTGSIFVNDTRSYKPTFGSWVPLSELDEDDRAFDDWDNTNNKYDEIVLVYDWVWESNDTEEGWIQAAADNLFASLANAPLGLGTSVFDLPLHFIGHSRGAVVNSLVTNLIGHYFPDTVIDQVTSLDPHPIDADGNPYEAHDPQPVTYDNVRYADNYYRQDGEYQSILPLDNKDFDGVAVPGARNIELTEGVLIGQDPYFLTNVPRDGGHTRFLDGAEHADTHLWYSATIAPSDTTIEDVRLDEEQDEDGQGPANEEEAGWWNSGTGWLDSTDETGEPASGRDQVGFRRSRIGGGDRSGLDDFVQSAGHEITNPGYSVFNGSFSFGDLLFDEIPGWERHGGEVDGNLIVDTTAGSVKVHLGENGTFNFTSVRHNPLYFPTTVKELEFEYRITRDSNDDTLEVRIGNTLKHTVLLDTIRSDTVSISIANYAASVDTIEFQLNYGGTITSDVYIDNVVLLSGPVADAGGPYSARLGTIIELDASASYDLDGTITEYWWDLDNDGSFETPGQKVDFQTSADGEYTVQLRVTDSDGYRSDEVQSTINVSPGGASTGDGLDPQYDSYIEAANVDAKHGSDALLRADEYTAVAALLFFDIAGEKIPTNATIKTATLTLSTTKINDNVQLRRITRAWEESDVTWATRPSVGSHVYAAQRAHNTSVPLKIDVAYVFQKHTNGNWFNNGWQLTTDDATEVVFHSSEAAQDKRPKLTYTTTFLPQAQSGESPSITLGAKTADIQVIYTDDFGVDASDIGTGDIKVEGPSFNTVATLISKTPAGDAKRIVATYRIEAPNQEQGWTSENNGSYSVTLLAKQVSDTEFFDNYVREANDHLPGSDFTIDLPPIPDNPTNLRTPGISSAQIDLRWDDKSAEETGFRIERKSGSDDFSYLKNLAADTETYADKSLAAGTEYTYRIRAYHNDAGPSGWSSEMAATTMFSDTPFVVAIDQSSISELDGTSTATVTRDVTKGDVIITLSASGDEVTPVPATVTIKDGETSASFRVDAVDDSLLDGTQADSITASASGYNSGSDNIEVTDYEELALTFDKNEIPEYLGTATATVTRTDSGEKLEVTLVNGDDTEVSIPATLTLEINELTGTFEIEAIHDREKDGTQQVTLTAKASGYVDAQSSIDVLNSDDAQILGIVWNDVDKNGIKDENEAGIGCWWVWAEQDGDASRESTELQTLTKTDGTYSILDVPKGRYDVQAELPDGFESTNLVRIKSDDVTVEQKNDVGISTAAGLAISQNRQHLYITDRSITESSVHFFSRDDSTGKLTHKAKYRFRDITSENTSYGTIDVAISPDGGHVYAVNVDDSSIFLFDRHQITGELQFKKTFGGSDAPEDIYLTADGRHLISANYGKNELRVFSRTSDPNSDEYGDISRIQSLKAGTGAHGASSVTGSPDNDKYIYATSGTDNLFVVLEWKDDDTLEVFQTFQHNNSPSNPGDVNGLQNPRTVAVSPDGRDIYVGTGGGHNVIWFRRNEETDKLSLQQVYKPGEAELEQVTSVVVSPGGNHVFATGRNSKTIAVFRRDLLSGALEYQYSLDNAATGLVKPGFIVVSGDNQHVYVTDYAGGKNVVVLERDVEPGGAQSVTVHPDLTTTNIDRGIYSESGSFPPAVDAPSSLIVTAISSSKISLAWTDNSDNETGFGIIRQIESSSDWITVTTTDEGVEGFVDSGLQPDTEYTYQIIATDGTCESSASDADSATTLVLPPAAPMNLIATDITTTTVDLEWQDKSDNETGFEVHRKLNSSSQWSLIETTSANLLVYADTQLSSATRFDYRVRAINAGGESGWTNIVVARTLFPLPAPPENLDAVAASASQIDLVWDDKSDNEDGFKVQFKEADNDQWTDIGSSATTTAANDSDYSHIDLKEGTTYSYRVRALHIDGTSGWSVVDSATTPIAPPVTPSGLVASSMSRTQIDLRWNDESDDEIGFRVYRFKAGNAEMAFTIVANRETFSDTGLEPATLYSYFVRSVKANNLLSNNSNTEIARTGVFNDARLINTSSAGVTSIFAIDMDADGDVDIVSASFDNDTVAWHENKGPDGFTQHTITNSAVGASSVYAVDLDGDEDIDVLSSSTIDGTVRWYENKGPDGFTSHIITSTAEYTYGVFATDMDDDKDIDVIVTSAARDHADTIAWYENNGNGQFTRHTVSRLPDGVTDVEAQDVDGDGDIDIVTAVWDSGAITWYENQNGTSFTSHTITPPDSESYSDVFVIDLDGDNDLDILAAGGIAGLSWYENNGDKTFVHHAFEHPLYYPIGVHAADLDGDGDMDVLAVDDANMAIWLENRGDKTFSVQVISTLGDMDILTADMDGDGDEDVITASYANNTIAWYENLSDVDTTPPMPTKTRWKVAPETASHTSLRMVATTASDPSGVEYFFECQTEGCNNRDWDSDPVFVDTGLMAGTQYQYNVVTRDKSPQNHKGKVSRLATVTTPAAWNNFAKPADVTGDDNVSPTDVLWIINQLNTSGSEKLPETRPEGFVAPFVDVDSDGYLTSTDAYMVINDINQRWGQQAEGEPRLIWIETPTPVISFNMTFATPVRTASTAQADSMVRYQQSVDDTMRLLADDPAVLQQSDHDRGTSTAAMDESLDEWLKRELPDLVE